MQCALRREEGEASTGATGILQSLRIPPPLPIRETRLYSSRHFHFMQKVFIAPLKLDFNLYTLLAGDVTSTLLWKKPSNFSPPGFCKRLFLQRSGNLFRDQDQHGWALKSLQEYNTHISRISFVFTFPSFVRARVCACVSWHGRVRLWDSCWQSRFMVFSPFGFNSSFQADRYSIPSPPPQLHLLWYSAGLKTPAVKKKVRGGGAGTEIQSIWRMDTDF